MKKFASKNQTTRSQKYVRRVGQIVRLNFPKNNGTIEIRIAGVCGSDVALEVVASKFEFVEE